MFVCFNVVVERIKNYPIYMVYMMISCAMAIIYGVVHIDNKYFLPGIYLFIELFYVTTTIDLMLLSIISSIKEMVESYVEEFVEKGEYRKKK